MPVVNATVAAIFEEIADLLDIQGANPFRIRAYRNAGRPAAAEVEIEEVGQEHAIVHSPYSKDCLDAQTPGFRFSGFRARRG